MPQASDSECSDLKANGPLVTASCKMSDKQLDHCALLKFRQTLSIPLRPLLSLTRPAAAGSLGPSIR